MQSLWWDGAHMPSFSPLSGDRSVDTLIVGGGMAGSLRHICSGAREPISCLSTAAG